MKKIINAPETYVDDMLKGIYAAHGDQVKYAEGDLRCYCTANKKPGKVAIITGGDLARENTHVFIAPFQGIYIFLLNYTHFLAKGQFLRTKKRAANSFFGICGAR